MKKFLVAAATAAAFCGAPVFAADMPVKASAAPYDPWTGFYVGGSVGARSSEVDWRTVTFSVGPPLLDNPASLDKTGVRIGSYVGYNWKIAPAWLAGLEADIAWGDNKKTHTPWPGTSGIFGAASGHDFVTAKLGLDGSLRGRLGVLVNPNSLVYATGGVAWQEIKTIATCDGTLPSACAAPRSESSSTIKAGWTIGGGVEAILSKNWFGRVEYRYSDFGHVSNNFGPGPSFTANVNVRTNTTLLGLAYKY